MKAAMTKGIWNPQPGPQTRALTCPADVILFGGTRGGGKSDCLIGRNIRGAEIYGDKWSSLILRRKYKDFSELRSRWRQLRNDGLPIEIVGGENQPNIIRFENGAQAQMIAVSRPDMLDDFQGHQYPEIDLDEAPRLPFFLKAIDKLRGCNRSPYGVPCSIFCTGNPGGSGHVQVKSFFQLGKDGKTPGTLVRYPIGDSGEVETRIFIQSFLDDNKYLVRNDPKYVNRLRSIQDPALKRAWLDGDWDVFIGQAFDFSEEMHVIQPHDPPAGAPLYMTYDWGFGRPFSIGWWYTDPDGRAIRFSEWYGWNGVPDEGARLIDSDVADGINEREYNMGISGLHIKRLCDPTCFNRKPNFQGGGQGPSTADVFSAKGIHLLPGDPSRALKIRAFREKLTYKPGERPMIQVTKNCKHFIRTIPALSMDEDNPEDIDTTQEDHVYDEACHIAMELGDHGRVMSKVRRRKI